MAKKYDFEAIGFDPEKEKANTKPFKKDNKKPTKNKGGRPSIYSDELARVICDRLADGETMGSICDNDPSMPDASTVYKWVLENKGVDEEGNNGFSQKYAEAREIQAKRMFDDIIKIADSSEHHAYAIDPKASGAIVQAQRLKVDTRKWYLSKVLPKLYGDKIDVTSGGKPIKGNAIVFKDFSDGAETVSE